MNPDDIQKELDRLWQKVTEGSPPESEPAYSPPAFSLSETPSITREVSLEAVALLKRQHRAELARVQQLLELKERTVRELSERLAATENEVAGLHRKSTRDEERIYQEVFQMSVELENAQKALKAQEASFREEEKMLRGVADETRRHLAAEIARWRELEKQWNEREQQYLLDLKELQALAQRAQQEAGKQDQAARRAMADLNEAKTAIEKTLAELLQERQQRSAADAERDKALARVKEVEEHMRDLQNIWEAERKQWQELWDRERSTWETQRQEFSSWEDKVRKDREAWHANMKELEDRESRFAGQMTDMLRKAAEAGEKTAALMRSFASPENIRRMFALRLTVLGRRLALGALAAALALAYPVWRSFHRLDLRLEGSYALPAQNPTAIAYDGATLWLCDWAGNFLSVDPSNPSTVVSRAAVAGIGAYHPSALALWGDSLYSLDSAQERVVRHASGSPGSVTAQWPAPGPAPVALAHDGQNLWSYDAVTRILYRHLGDGAGAQTDAFSLDLDVLPSAMAWNKGELWIYDSKGKQLMAFALKGHHLKLGASRRFLPAIESMALAYRSSGAGQRLELWTLTSSASGQGAPVLQKYRVR